ncbi:MAG: hypothetical protein ACREJO_05035 [Phycisphaerales bacterium]
MFTLADYEDTLKVSEVMGKVIAIAVVLIVIAVIIKAVRGNKGK